MDVFIQNVLVSLRRFIYYITLYNILFVYNHDKSRLIWVKLAAQSINKKIINVD